MPLRRCIPLVAAICLLFGRAVAEGDARVVADDQALRTALRSANPGTTIRIAPGTYRDGIHFDRSGTADRPVVIESADPELPVDEMDRVHGRQSVAGAG